MEVIGEADVRRLLPPGALLEPMRQALAELSAGRALQPLRTVLELPPPGSLLFVKPALAGGALAVKMITQVPQNAARGLPTMQAKTLLIDPQTGAALALIDATWLSEQRTAAVSAVAADLLTPAGPKVVALLGSGALARSHAAALREVRPVAELRVWSRDPANVARCAADTDGIACASAEEAVRGADIVCTVTNASEPVLRGAWLGPGAFVAAVGAPRPGWRELDDEAMANVVVADSREAALAESGDVIQSGAKVYAEIGELILGRVAPPPEGTTVVFKSLGQAVEDALAARLVYEAALAARGAQ